MDWLSNSRPQSEYKSIDEGKRRVHKYFNPIRYTQLNFIGDMFSLQLGNSLAVMSL